MVKEELLVESFFGCEWHNNLIIDGKLSKHTAWASFIKINLLKNALTTTEVEAAKQTILTEAPGAVVQFCNSTVFPKLHMHSMLFRRMALCYAVASGNQSNNYAV